MSEHVRVETSGGVLAITLARPERRNAITVAMYAALAEAIESAADDDSIRLITFQRRGPGFRRRQRPRRFPERLAARHDDIPGLAPASRARPMRISDRRRGPRQLRRHRHDDAAALRSGRRRGGRALFAAVRRPRAGARGGELAAPAAPCRPPARRALSPARRSLRRRRGDGDRARQPSVEAGRLERSYDRLVARVARQAAGALRQTQRLLRTGARDEILERMRLEGEAFAERLASAEAKDAIAPFSNGRKPGPAT